MLEECDHERTATVLISRPPCFRVKADAAESYIESLIAPLSGYLRDYPFGGCLRIKSQHRSPETVGVILRSMLPERFRATVCAFGVPGLSSSWNLSRGIFRKQIIALYAQFDSVENDYFANSLSEDPRPNLDRDSDSQNPMCHGNRQRLPIPVIRETGAVLGWETGHFHVKTATQLRRISF